MQNNSESAGSIAWPVALVTTAVLGTLASACLMPFVAVGVATAATMSRARAAATIGGIWAINQALGFGLLGYPPTVFAVAWGLALGAAALLAMLVARGILGSHHHLTPRLLTAFAAGFAAFEGGLYGFALVAGGTGTFTVAIIAQILTNDALWFVGLIALHLALTRAAPGLFGTGLSLRPA